MTRLWPTPSVLPTPISASHSGLPLFSNGLTGMVKKSENQFFNIKKDVFLTT
jgi:hypothetical protein